MYELKKIYYGLLAKDPECPAWEAFEYRNLALNQPAGDWRPCTGLINRWGVGYVEYREKAMKTNIFDAEEMIEFAETERMKERARIMLLARGLAKELDSLVVNDFILELADKISGTGQ